MFRLMSIERELNVRLSISNAFRVTVVRYSVSLCFDTRLARRAHRLQDILPQAYIPLRFGRFIHRRAARHCRSFQSSMHSFICPGINVCP